MLKNFLLSLVCTSAVFAVSIEESTIPVLDMEDYYNKDKHSTFVDKLSKAMREYGFFAIVNAPIDQKIMGDAFESARKFFAQPLDVKNQINGESTNAQRGYMPFGVEKAKGNTVADWKEYLMIGREMFPEASKRLGHYLNIWPDSIKIKIPMVRFYNTLEDWMVPIQHAIEESLELKKNFLNKMTFEGDNSMRVIHYPVQKPKESSCGEWAAEHTDINLFTINPQASAEGLEIQSKDGEWIRVQVPENSFIINCGDMLEHMTNGYFHSAKHRVKQSEKNREDRYAMILYVHARNADRMDPLPQCIEWTGGKRLYANATRWELLMERLADLGSCTQKMLEDLAASGLMERMIALDRASPDAMRRLKAANLASPAVCKKLKELDAASK